MQAFAIKREEVMAERYRDFEFWKADPAETALRATLKARRSAVDADMNAVLKELLGPEFVTPSAANEWKMAELQCQLNFLPSDKRSAIGPLLLKFADVDDRVQKLAGGLNLTEDIEQRRRILEQYDAMREKLGALLTPEEFEQVELATSVTAENLRRAMVNFRPTEQEFQMLFREWREYDAMLARIRATGQADPGNLRKPLEERVRQFLGDERAKEYWRTWWK